MDLSLLFRVIWRFKLLLAVGLLVAVVLSTVSFAHVSFNNGAKPTFTYRETEQWESLATIFVTSSGFPWGSAYDANSQVVLPNGTVASVPTLSATRLSGLAALYMELATSDPVFRMMLKGGPINGALRTYPIFPGGDSASTPLPMITFSAVATTSASAKTLNQRWVNAFERYLHSQQARADIPAEKRAVLQVVRKSQPAHLIQGRKKTHMILVFMTVMIAFFGLAFILENLRPRVQGIAVEQPEQLHASVDVESPRLTA